MLQVAVMDWVQTAQHSFHLEGCIAWHADLTLCNSKQMSTVFESHEQHSGQTKHMHRIQ